MATRLYSELKHLKSFEERYEYLRLGGGVGRETFGFDRYLNQMFYSSAEWRRVRREVAIRDNGCDLGISGREISQGVLIHHMNPISIKDIVGGEDWILNPEFLITTNQCTHNAIHYGSFSTIPSLPVERRPGDTKLW